VFLLRGRTVVCLASFFLQQESFLAYDLDFVVARFRSEIAYLYRNWTLPGRPLVTVLLTRQLLAADRTSFHALMRKLATGEVDNVPVRLRPMAELLPTAGYERIDDLDGLEFSDTPWKSVIEGSLVLAQPRHETPLDPTAEREIELATDRAWLLDRLARSDNPYEQIELLTALANFMSSDTPIDIRGARVTLGQLLEEVYQQAGRRRLWGVVRQAAGLLNKVDGDLGLALGAILVRRKNVQVGRAYSEGSWITHPIQERELLAKIATFCREDVRDRVLTQELILYASLLIKARPELFQELITIRIGQLIMLLTSDIMRREKLTTGEAYEALMRLGPSQIQAALEAALVQYHSLEALPQELEHLSADGPAETLHWRQDLGGLEQLETPREGWLAWRQHRGVIDRRSPAFYGAVWNLFRHVPGLIVGDKVDRRNLMDSQVVLSDMTPNEPAFALWLEHLLNKIHAAEYRQVSIEALEVLVAFFRANPAVHIHEPISLDVLIGHAVRLAYLERHPEHDPNYNEHKPEAWESFYASPPAETSVHLSAALRHLLLVVPR